MSPRKAKPTYPEIAPFRALRYVPERAKTDLSHLVCPPYDVIDKDEHQRLASASPYNAVHLILPKINERFNVPEGTYSYNTQAALLTKMRSEGVLAREKQPAIYVVHQVFSNPYKPNESLTRKGLIVLKRLSDFSSGSVRPHEKTLAGPKLDRLNVLRALRSNMSPIFGLYADAQKKVEALFAEQVTKEKPLAEFETKFPEPITHRLWVVTDPQVITDVCKQLGGAIYIADGHHRYETALTFAREVDESIEGTPADGAHHYLPVYLANLADEGVLILPTHRMVHTLANFRADYFLNNLKERFSVEPLALGASPTMAQLQAVLSPDGPTRFVMRFWAGKAERIETYLLTIPDAIQRGELDLKILHQEILEKDLGIDARAQEEQTNLRYTRDPAKASEELKEKRVQIVFFTRPPTAAQMQQYCESGQRMPQKSTYFYPKVLTGLVFRPIDPHESVQL